MNRESTYALLSGLAASLAGLAVRHMLERIWESTTDSPPPEDPTAEEVRWRDALVWTLVSAGTVAAARIATRRVAAAGWRAAGRPGMPLPGLKGD